MQPFGYARPRSVAEAVALLQEHEGARLLAGGTDLTVGLRDGVWKPALVMDIKRMADLPPSIEQDGDRLCISANTVLTTVVADESVRRYFPALVEAADVVGSIQIRNRATLAGNIANASPAADTVPALVIHGATVVLRGPEGERQVLVHDFITGNRRTVLKPGELIVAVSIPVPRQPVGTAFARLTRRRGVDLATINVCCSVDSRGEVLFAFGAVSPRPLRVADSSGVLADPDASPADRDAALDAVVGEASPISDVRASADYRSAMLRVLSRRALHHARTQLDPKEDG